MHTAKKQISSLQTYSVLAAIFVVLALQPAVMALAADVSRAFNSSETLVAGTLVSLDATKKDTVVPANSTDTRQLIGVVVAKNGSLLSIDDTATTAQVAVSGRANALVSTLNGPVKTGDMIAESPITGVGALALSGEKVVGIAQGDFTETSQNTSKQTITQTDGKPKEVIIGSVPLIVAVGQAAGGQGEGNYGGGLKGLLSGIAGKEVSSARVVMTGFIAFMTIIVLGVMVYSAIRNGITASSRNPLAKPVIFESLAQVFVMIILISLVSLVINYAILRL